MTRFLKLVALDKPSKEGKEILIRLEPGLDREYKGAYLHLPSLNRVRLKALKEREGRPNTRLRGIARERLKKGDRFLPLNAPLLAGRSFYGRLEGLRPGEGGELIYEGRELSYRILPAEGDLVRLEATGPLALKPGKPFKLARGNFHPAAMKLWNPEAEHGDLLALQGWRPVGLDPGEEAEGRGAEFGPVSGAFRFSPAWLEEVRRNLTEISRREGGFLIAGLPELVDIPPYLSEDLQRLLERESSLRFSGGILIDRSWDYANSLSPMAKGILAELTREGIQVEKIPDSPRQRALRLLVRCGLAEEFDEGIFAEAQFFQSVYSQVAELREAEPEIGLRSLAARTGVKKRFLIPLLQHGDMHS